MEMETDEDETYVRNLEDVKSMIKHAKLDELNLTHITQAIYYTTEDEERHTMKLLELDSHLLSQIKEGQTLQFKGGLSEKAVLCTEDRTYDIKEAETSNSLLILPDLKFAQETSTSPLKSPKGGLKTTLERSLNDSDDELDYERQLEHKTVIKIIHEYFECREIKPRFRKLSDLLKLTRYSGPEHEYCVDRKVLFTYNQLLDTTQCSPKEFEQGLINLRAIRIDDHTRVLDYEYEFRVVSCMLGLISENSWNSNEVDREVTIDSLDGIAPSNIVEELFRIYTTPSDIENKYQYKEDFVARLIAQNILRPRLKFLVDEFFSTWQEAMPEGMQIDETCLRGLGVVDKEATTPCVRALAEDTLPTNIHERLKVLFKTKQRWTLDQMEPYMEYFSAPSCPVTTLLTKYTRSLMVDGQRYYVPKHM